MPIIECPTYQVSINEDYSDLDNYIKELDPSQIFLIVDENTKEHCLPTINQKLSISYRLLEIESGEIHKNIKTASDLWEALMNYNADRKSIIINLGGGVIGDMGGFVASTFMRGIKFIQMPTTLLSQVDASIGGKLGIDFKAYKNMIGMFQNPNHVWVDTSFLKTLPADQLLSGYAEVIKHALIQSSDLWKSISSRSLDYTDEEWAQIVFDSIEIKNKVVAQDPKEKGLRKILNFGHTIGHAVESFYLGTEKELTHGKAIAVGMICESYLALKEGLIKQTDFDNIHHFIRKTFNFDPTLKISQKAIIEYMTHDKKNEGGKILFSLIDAIGHCTFNKSIDKSAILDALNYFER